jgi:hypothetical protein
VAYALHPTDRPAGLEGRLARHRGLVCVIPRGYPNASLVVPAGELPDPGLFVGALPIGVLAGTDLGEGALRTSDRVGGFRGCRDANLVLVVPARLAISELADIGHGGLCCVRLRRVVDSSTVGVTLGLDVRELVLVRDLPVLVVGLDA